MSDSNNNPVPVLTEIATEIIINELKRRAAAVNMTTDELLYISDANWREAEADAGDLQRLGHEPNKT